MQTVFLLAATALAVWSGKEGVFPESVEQPSWRVLRIEETEEGIWTETVGRNLMLESGVRVEADSTESSAFAVQYVRDGIAEDERLRWSSANDWENNEHWLTVCFPGTVTVGAVRICWERDNALEYALEYSEDKKNWQQAASFSERPESVVQNIVLGNPVQAKYLRLHVTAVAKEEADLSLYYQNVSLLELEVYEGIEDAFLVERPEIPAGSRRTLLIQDNLPAGYSLEFAGADYETLVDETGRIADTLSAVEAELGFALVKDGYRQELPGMKVTIPGSDAVLSETISSGDDSALPGVAAALLEAVSAGTGDVLPETAEPEAVLAGAGFTLPEGYSYMEWQPAWGVSSLTDETRIVVPERHREELQAIAEIFAGELSEVLGREVELVWAEDSRDDRYQMERDDIYLSFLQDYEGEIGPYWTETLGEEGYELDLQNVFRGGFQIYGRTAQGVRWGCVSFLELLEKTGGELPCGSIRDYPRYSVRGFGIDVGRRPITLALLYEIVEAMSARKMNTLLVHLNDNQIISQSGYDGTLAGARSLYAGFRLESEIRNEAGEGITSEDLFYTKEEFARFIEDAAAYGVEVVPEIDTPAHSLSLTKVFPQLGLNGDPEGADQLDLSKEEAVQLGKDLWKEYLTVRSDGAGQSTTEGTGGADQGTAESAGSAVFENCRAVHIGMDEYFGDERDYISYLTELSAYVSELAPEKEIRIWGSLSKITADHSGVSRKLQMHIWDTDWADPAEMYEEGFGIINSLSSSLYIIPGGGYDWLDQEFLEQEWQPNIFWTQERTWVIPAYSPRMLGACYMLWNDWAQENGEDISEADLFARFEKPLAAIAGKLWGEKD